MSRRQVIDGDAINELLRIEPVPVQYQRSVQNMLFQAASACGTSRRLVPSFPGNIPMSHEELRERG
jgi:hypothetical protein